MNSFRRLFWNFSLVLTSTLFIVNDIHPPTFAIKFFGGNEMLERIRFQMKLG